MLCVKCKSELPPGAMYCPKCGKKQAASPPRKRMKRPNGTGTVYKLSGRRTKPWAAAKEKVIIGYYQTRTEALEALEKLSGMDIVENYNMTFSQVYQGWSKEHFPKLSKWGVQAYEGSYKAFSSLHQRKFRSLRTSDFQAVLDAIEGKSEVKKKHKQLLGQMSKWAMREEIIATNYAQFVEIEPSPKKEKEIFTAEDIEKLTKNNSETAKIILMLIYTGMRIGELFSLTLQDYHGDYVVGGSKTEAGRNRIIPIRPEGKTLFAYFAGQATDPLLLSGYTGQKNPNNFRRRDYYPLLDKLGIARKSPHSTRHTFTSWAVKSGMSPEILQKILGHADFSTTANVYTHMSPEDILSEMQKLTVTNTLLTNQENKNNNK